MKEKTTISVGRLVVPCIEYKFYKRKKKTESTVEVSVAFKETNYLNDDTECLIQLDTIIKSSDLSCHIIVEGSFLFQAAVLTEEDIVNNENLYKSMLVPLSSKVSEVFSKLTGDSGPYPLIFTLNLDELAKTNDEFLENET